MEIKPALILDKGKGSRYKTKKRGRTLNAAEEVLNKTESLNATSGPSIPKSEILEDLDC